MELKDTIEMMNSEDYKERFKAEYYQTLIRYNRLSKMMESWDKVLTFGPFCDKKVAVDQLSFMAGYLDVLRDRAFVEDIELEEI